MVNTHWLTEDERAAWVRLVAIVELLPGVLDAQLRKDSGLAHFEYFALAMLSEAPGRTLRMTELARRTNATLPRLSHVVKRLEGRGLVERARCVEDGRATNVFLAQPGWDVVVAAAPGHVATVRGLLLDRLTPDQVHQLHEIGDSLLGGLDPTGRLAGLYASPSERDRDAAQALDGQLVAVSGEQGDGVGQGAGEDD